MDKRKTLELRKTATGRKTGKYLYEVIENGKPIASRRSNREYVACLVSVCGVNSESFYLPYFFGRKDLIGKGDSAPTAANCYALAEITNQ